MVCCVGVCWEMGLTSLAGHVDCAGSGLRLRMLQLGLYSGCSADVYSALQSESRAPRLGLYTWHCSALQYITLHRQSEILCKHNRMG